jgi:peroxiredoxin
MHEKIEVFISFKDDGILIHDLVSISDDNLQLCRFMKAVIKFVNELNLPVELDVRDFRFLKFLMKQGFVIEQIVLKRKTRSVIINKQYEKIIFT